jgi:DNA-binding XRE family transcriptional regulator
MESLVCYELKEEMISSDQTDIEIEEGFSNPTLTLCFMGNLFQPKPNGTESEVVGLLKVFG